jgi:quinoprotein glucose dehydrogenase
MKKVIYFLGLFLFAIVGAAFFQDGNPTSNWAEYLGGADRNHYSELTQITPENVTNLEIAWTYETPQEGQMQVNPLIIDGVLYGVTSSVQAFALDAATGKELWRFGDPLNAWHSTSRGVSYWQNGSDKRIFHSMGSFLWAIDASTGKPIESFGESGKIDMHQGLPANSQDKFLISNTPGTIFENLIYMPVRLSEGADAAPGDIRAFDVITGKLVWTFHTIPYPNEFGYETFPKDAYQNTYTGGANNWAGMALDKEKGILFVPTGSAGYDFYGGNRKGQNLFANCLLALDARTGKRIWHFQTTHHDIWDKDLPAPPNLLTVEHKGKRVEAVAQVTKQGYVFLFDRKNGKPLFPIKEVKVPASNLVGEETWATQPIPSLPAPFSRLSEQLTEKDISPYAENRTELLEKFRSYKKQLYAPPSEEGTIILPGFDGGAEWGGAAADPQKGILYVNSNEMAWIQTMLQKPTEDIAEKLPLGQKTYANYCVSCHQPDLEGNPESGYPSLTSISTKFEKTAALQLITNGKGMMPGFNFLSKDEKESLVQFLYGEEKQEVGASKETTKKVKLPYEMSGYNKFLDKNGLPAIAPPWGRLSAIDLNTGKYLWQIPFGNEPKLETKGISGTGTENYGGPIITASGLLFIAASKDGKFRAFDKATGKLLWETKLPAAGFATPSTYMVNGKQYVVIACGGTKLGTPKGNKYVAFALKK